MIRFGFKFGLKAQVIVDHEGKKYEGTVTGRAQYVGCDEDKFYVSINCHEENHPADGWYDESHLSIKLKVVN